MTHTIRFKRSGGETDDVLADRIRAAARSDGWTGREGFNEWARINYRAKLRFGVTGLMTSIKFKDEQDMVRFLLTMS